MQMDKFVVKTATGNIVVVCIGSLIKRDESASLWFGHWYAQIGISKKLRFRYRYRYFKNKIRILINL